MVSSVVFSPDRHTLASVGRDAIRLWNVTDPTHPAPLGELTIQNDVIGPVVFSPDGRTLASAGNTVGLWELNLDQAIRKICATSGNLTREQWQQYIPDLPYNPSCA